MPLYEYECDACGHRFEVIQKFSDAPVETCPKCGGSVHKVQSAPAFQFKGSGWYITDYAKKGSSTAEGASSNGAGKGEKSDKTETKTEAKAETKSKTKAEKPTKSESSSGTTKDS